MPKRNCIYSLFLLVTLILPILIFTRTCCLLIMSAAHIKMHFRILLSWQQTVRGIVSAENYCETSSPVNRIQESYSFYLIAFLYVLNVVTFYKESLYLLTNPSLEKEILTYLFLSHSYTLYWLYDRNTDFLTETDTLYTRVPLCYQPVLSLLVHLPPSSIPPLYDWCAKLPLRILWHVYSDRCYCWLFWCTGRGLSGYVLEIGVLSFWWHSVVLCVAITKCQWWGWASWKRWGSFLIFFL